MKWESELRQEKRQNWISKWTKKEMIWKIANFQNSQFYTHVTHLSRRHVIYTIVVGSCAVYFD